MRILGLLISFGLIGLAAFSSGGLSPILDVPSLIVVVGLTLGGLLMSGSPVGLMIKSLFVSTITGEERQAAAEGWKRAHTYARVSGFIGFIVGLTLLGHFLELPEQVGVLLPALALLYGLALSYFICLPIHLSLKDAKPA